MQSSCNELFSAHTNLVDVHGLPLLEVRARAEHLGDRAGQNHRADLSVHLQLVHEQIELQTSAVSHWSHDDKARTYLSNHRLAHGVLALHTIQCNHGNAYSTDGVSVPHIFSPQAAHAHHRFCGRR